VFMSKQFMPSVPPTLTAPSDDKRWRIVGATMRRYGYAPSALIETLHTVQEAFGYLDESALVYVARSLRVPLSKVYGVATFYTIFRLKPQGKHTCVVCLGTACYIKGGPKILSEIEKRTSILAGETTRDNKVSLLIARCLGACGIAPTAVFDGLVLGNLTPDGARARVEEWIAHE
jgi:bidirectional [NiFe] hydrogenase diaphorase subunit